MIEDITVPYVEVNTLSWKQYRLKVDGEVPTHVAVRAILELLEAMQLRVGEDIVARMPEDLKCLFEEVNP